MADSDSQDNASGWMGRFRSRLREQGFDILPVPPVVPQVEIPAWLTSDNLERPSYEQPRAPLGPLADAIARFEQRAHRWPTPADFPKFVVKTPTHITPGAGMIVPIDKDYVVTERDQALNRRYGCTTIPCPDHVGHDLPVPEPEIPAYCPKCGQARQGMLHETSDLEWLRSTERCMGPIR